MIIPLQGDDLGVLKRCCYRLFEWNERGRVVFSITQQGLAIKCHFSAEKKALRYLRVAFNEFVDWVFDKYQWCRMVIATVIKEKQSIIRAIKKCAFKHVLDYSNGHVYARVR